MLQVTDSYQFVITAGKNLETKIFINAKTQILQDVWSRRVVYEVFFEVSM